MNIWSTLTAWPVVAVTGVAKGGASSWQSARTKSTSIAMAEGGWTRRSRAGWAWRDEIEVPLGEEREAYRLEWASGNQDLSVSVFIYTAAMRADDVTGGATVMTFTIRQSGDAALSPPLFVTVDLV